ncbi:MAG: hypothetical protein EHM42_14965, partial [Planctomycetaceae bacterium]
MDDRRCFLFTGGGTGGHITPGLAVAQMLRTRLPGSRIVFAGAGRAVELKLLANEEFRALPVEPMRR